MGCVSSACFAVLFNGSPSNFFKASRGIRQGCPLSPLLFILIIESLSRIILNAHLVGHITDYQYTPDLSITHLLFVDDVLLFGIGTVGEWDILMDTIISILLARSQFRYHAWGRSFLDIIVTPPEY